MQTFLHFLLNILAKICIWSEILPPLKIIEEPESPTIMDSEGSAVMGTVGPFRLKQPLILVCLSMVKTIGSIVSSIMPKFYGRFFLIYIFVQVVNRKFFRKLKQKQYHVHNLYKIRRSTKNTLSNCGIIEETMGLLLALCLHTYLYCIFRKVVQCLFMSYYCFANTCWGIILCTAVILCTQYCGDILISSINISPMIFTAIYVGQFLFFLLL